MMPSPLPEGGPPRPNKRSRVSPSTAHRSGLAAAVYINKCTAGGSGVVLR